MKRSYRKYPATANTTNMITMTAGFFAGEAPLEPPAAAFLGDGGT
jgi:hypothetical protein